MPSHTQKLDVDGPCLEVTIRIPKALEELYRKLGLPIPVPVSGKILIDSGASVSGVDKTILLSLNLPAVGETCILTPSGKSTQYLYPARLEFKQPAMSIEFNHLVPVVGVDLSQQNIIALLGRDMLKYFVFTLDGPKNELTISLKE